MKQLTPLSPQYPLWYAGFRPFFTFAMLMGLVLPAMWGLVFSGKLLLPEGLNPIQWHAHEMLFGFGGAVLIGFLLTSSKNWVGVRGIHGAGLMALAGLWLFERFFIYFASDINKPLKYIGLSLFITASGFYIISTLIKYRVKDSYRDNYFFIILLGAIIIAKNLLISEESYQHGVALTVGLFRLAFTVMFERTITQFMKVTEGLELYRNKIFDFLVKFSVLISMFESYLPQGLAVAVLTLAAVLLMVRWILWRPDIGFRKFANATMYLGFLGLILHFAFEISKVSGIWSVGTIALHTFTFLCMGVVIPGMFVRISQGHTGRKPLFFPSDKVAIALILVSAVFRLVLPLVFPESYAAWILLAGLLWSVSFLLLGIRLIPFLFQARIDGKEH